MELDKTYDAAAVQDAVAKVWDDERCFHAEPDDPGEPFAVLIPPPNVTAALHLGHAFNNTLQDILVRRARMQGKNAVWLPGTDHAGIATQTVVEKRVLAEEGKRRVDFERDEFVGKIQSWKDEYEARITEQLKLMGCSCDFERQAFTMDEPRAAAVREAFFRLFKDGLIYRGKRLVNWDPATQTALADDEVENEEIDGHFYYLKYPLSDNGEAASAAGQTTEYVTVATTRPETMLGDTAVAINPKDPRAASLRGKKILLPIVDREIPIVEDDYVVMQGADDPKATFATGFLKVTPAHDQNDWDIGTRHDLPVINIMAPDASISADHGWTPETDAAKPFVGLSREEARKQIVAWFKDNDLLEEIKPYRHSVGHSYRSHVAVEPYLSDQWYVAVKQQIPSLPDAGTIDGTDVPRHSLAGLALSSLEETGDDGVRFIPDRYAKTFRMWHENIRDWCISRQLWWGHRIPVWSGHVKYVTNHIWGHDGVSKVPFLDPGKLPDEPDPPLSSLVRFEVESDDEEAGLQYTHYCLPSHLDKPIRWLADEDLTQDPDVLDTWFSSALWPMSTLGWPEKTDALAKWNPTSVLCTAREIITLWVSRMVMFNRYLLADEQTPGPSPFKDVFIHAVIQDGEGRKMSKSLGNGVDPLEIIDSHGADAMRFVLCQMSTHTQDVRLPVLLVCPHCGHENDTPAALIEKLPTVDCSKCGEPIRRPGTSEKASGKLGRNTSPRFDLGRNFCNKLWNASRFVLGNLADAPVTEVDPAKLDDAGKWILSRLARTIEAADAALADYRFDRYATACYDFFWRDFCDWYVERAKPVLREGGDAAGQAAGVLAACLDASLRLMQPMIPFATERLWWALNDIRPQRGAPGLNLPAGERCITAAWPTSDGSLVSGDAEAAIETVQEVAVAIRTVRNENKVEPRRKVPVTIRDGSDVLKRNAELIQLWATCESVSFSSDEPESAAKTTAAGAEIFVAGVVDAAAEEGRLAKEKADLEKKIKTLTGRLSNKGYTDKAPEHLVQQTRDELANAEAELAKLS